jgi:rhodanese-related sulfurtransferase
MLTYFYNINAQFFSLRTIDNIKKLYPEVRINEADKDYQLPGTVNITFPQKDGLRLLAGLDCYEVFVSIGSACTADKIVASHVLLGMGLSEQEALSTIRISMGLCTSEKDINYFSWALKHVLKGDPAGFSFLDPKDLTQDKIESDDTFVIDLRFPYERMLLPSIPGAKLWSHIGFDLYIKKIPKDKEVILMCSTGIFSLGAGYRLANKGHSLVKVVFGGYNAWRAIYKHGFTHKG